MPSADEAIDSTIKVKKSTQRRIQATRKRMHLDTGDTLINLALDVLEREKAREKKENEENKPVTT